MAEPTRHPALPSWVAFLAAGLCFVAAGYLATTASLWSSPWVGTTPLLGLPDALTDVPFVTPLALVATGLTLLVCARLTPARPALWRALTYPTAIVATLAACALCGAHVLTFQHVAGSLRAAPYLEGAPLPMTAPSPLPASIPPQPATPTPVDPANLVTRLAASRPSQRDAAASQLLELGPEAIPLLGEALADPGFAARPVAANVLCEILRAQPVAGAEGLLALLACLDASHPVALRAAAARALAELNDMRCVGALVAAYDPAVPELVTALNSVTDVSHPTRRSAARWWRLRLAAYGPQLGRQPAQTGVAPLAIDELVAALGSQSPRVDEVLIERLALLGRAAIPPLARALRAPARREARGSLAWALGAALAQLPEDERDPAALGLVLRVLEEPGESGARAARGLLSLNDPRTVATQVRSFDAAEPARVAALKVVTGEVLTSWDQAQVWWDEHRRGYPTQLQPQAELVRLTDGSGQPYDHFPGGAVLILEGWFPHGCPRDDCRHESVRLRVGDDALLLLDATSDLLTSLLPATLPAGRHTLHVEVDGRAVGSVPLTVVEQDTWREHHASGDFRLDCGCLDEE
jgi:HEAT repeat protein